MNYTILFVVIQGVLERVCKSSIAIMVELYDPARCNTGCSVKFFKSPRAIITKHTVHAHTKAGSQQSDTPDVTTNTLSLQRSTIRCRRMGGNKVQLQIVFAVVVEGWVLRFSIVLLIGCIALRDTNRQLMTYL